jgi:hypothetical protein
VLRVAPRDKPIGQLARLSLRQAEANVVFVSFHREGEIASEIVIVRPLGDCDLEGVPDAAIEPDGVGRHVNTLVVELSAIVVFHLSRKISVFRHTTFMQQRNVLDSPVAEVQPCPYKTHRTMRSLVAWREPRMTVYAKPNRKVVRKHLQGITQIRYRSDIGRWVFTHAHFQGPPVGD